MKEFYTCFIYLPLNTIIVLKAGGNSEFPVNMHQKEQLHENVVSMMQSQHLPVSYSFCVRYTFPDISLKATQ